VSVRGARKVGSSLTYALLRHMGRCSRICIRDFALRPRSSRPDEGLKSPPRSRSLKLVQNSIFADRYPSTAIGRTAAARSQRADARSRSSEGVAARQKSYGALDDTVRQALRPMARRYQDEIKNHQRFVTHDQEEALKLRRIESW